MLPMTLEVGLHTYSAGEPNRYNVVEPVYTPPRDQPGTPVKVYGWAVTTTREPSAPGPSPHNMVVTEVDLFAPPGFTIAPHDVVDLPDGQYEVIGDPQTFQQGPFGSTLGTVVALKKVIF
jgi:hypothetical protein